jgi:DNA-binding response OmpR family regulator
MSLTPLPLRLSPEQLASRLRPRVLIVARDAAERELIDRTLEQAGFETLSVGDVLGAYWALRGYSASVILLDPGLPREDRDEFRAIVARDRRMEGAAVVVLGAPPIKPEQLVVRVREALSYGS